MNRLNRYIVNLKHVSIAVMLALLVFTCKNALEEEPDSLFTAGNFYKTAEDALLAVNAAYDHMASGTSNSDAGGVYMNNYWVIQAITSDEGFASGANNPQFSLPLTDFTWDPNNGYILDVWEDCYKTINVTNVALANIPGIEMDEGLKTRFLAECRFVRGLMYFELVRMFGDIPYLTEPTEDLSSIDITRTSAEDVYVGIIEDLEFAKANLPLAYSANADIGRATIGAAAGYLAKVHLTRGEWASSRQEAQSVIDLGINTLQANFADIFTIANNNNSELVYTVNFTFNNDAIWETSQFNVRTLPLELNKNSLSWELPTQYVYDIFDSFDTRRDVTMAVSWTDPSTSETFTFQPHVFKYWDQVAEPTASSSGNDFFNLRYSDILLMKAEAINEVSGSNTEAYDAINQVRNRAGLANLAAGLSQDAFRDAVLEERLKEFVFEGQRWFDLVRTGKLKEQVEMAKPSVTVDMSKHILFPIPQREIDVNPNLTQNPGYR